MRLIIVLILLCLASCAKALTGTEPTTDKHNLTGPDRTTDHLPRSWRLVAVLARRRPAARAVLQHSERAADLGPLG